MSTELVPANGTTAIEAAPRYSDVLEPIAKSDALVKAWQAFEDTKRDLLSASDYQEYQGVKRTKKSGWLKIAGAFKLNLEIIRDERQVYETDKGTLIVYDCKARATAPNGRFAEALGSCASNERRFTHQEHDLRATAQTRAVNRAISNLVGGGEVSAEEVAGERSHLPTIAEARDLAKQCLDALKTDQIEPVTRVQFEDLLAAVVANGGDLRAAYTPYKASQKSQAAKASPIEGEIIRSQQDAAAMREGPGKSNSGQYDAPDPDEVVV